MENAVGIQFLAVQELVNTVYRNLRLWFAHEIRWNRLIKIRNMFSNTEWVSKRKKGFRKRGGMIGEMVWNEKYPRSLPKYLYTSADDKSF